VKGQTYGIELAVTSQFNEWLSLRGGYTFLIKELLVKSNSQDLNNGTAESDDPRHQFLIQSNIAFTSKVELGTVLRYIDKLTKPYVREYAEMDVKIGWKLNKIVELIIVGQNLLNNNHAEFIPSSPAPRNIERSIYGKITFRL
jgi:iron complex outermembrane receptor protein